MTLRRGVSALNGHTTAVHPQPDQAEIRGRVVSMSAKLATRAYPRVLPRRECCLKPRNEGDESGRRVASAVSGAAKKIHSTSCVSEMGTERDKCLSRSMREHDGGWRSAPNLNLAGGSKLFVLVTSRS